MTTAAASAMAAAVQPLVDAGVRVRAAITPAAALAGIARSRRANSIPDVIEAYIALEETATCVALIRGGALMAARDLPWGFLEEHGTGTEPRRREDIAARLGDDLADFFAVYEDAGRVGQVCICGGLPELRSTTLPLMERFDVEVETLDSLFGIDHEACRSRPTNSASARRNCGWHGRLPPIGRPSTCCARNAVACRSAVLSRAAVVAGVVFGFGGAWASCKASRRSRRRQRTWRTRFRKSVPTSPRPFAHEPPVEAVASPPSVQEPPSIAPEPALGSKSRHRSSRSWHRLTQEPALIKREPADRAGASSRRAGATADCRAASDRAGSPAGDPLRRHLRSVRSRRRFVRSRWWFDRTRSRAPPRQAARGRVWKNRRCRSRRC